MDSKTFFSGIRTMVVQSIEKGETKDENAQSLNKSSNYF